MIRSHHYIIIIALAIFALAQAQNSEPCTISNTQKITIVCFQYILGQSRSTLLRNHLQLSIGKHYRLKYDILSI